VVQRPNKLVVKKTTCRFKNPTSSGKAVLNTLFVWPLASSTFLSEQISHQQLASSTFLSEQISTSHQPPTKRIGCKPPSPTGVWDKRIQVHSEFPAN
jgi:hypothetical protein